MTTPSHYLRQKLKKILKNQYHLYHWTSLEAAINIVKDGYIYSKAMLFGLYYHSSPGRLSNIKPLNVIEDSKNGFIDYVFLGNTDWADSDTSEYGDVCFVINPLALLPNREFFVFPFYSGRYFSKKGENEKTSDIRTLMEALEGKQSCSEILVRRRVKINPSNVDMIVCALGKERLDEVLQEKKLAISVNAIKRSEGMPKASIKFVDPSDTKRKEICLEGDQYMQKGNFIYVKTEYSNCILALKINAENQLIDAETGDILGELLRDKPMLTR
jgi:hypothetical protein